MSPLVPTSPSADAWQGIERGLSDSSGAISRAESGAVRQAAFDALLAAERRATAAIHGWLAEALGLQLVCQPRLVLSLDVDGVLEDDNGGFSCADVAAVAGLRLLQLGGIAVLLNTGRDLLSVQDRAGQLKLYGGVGAFGSTTWDAVFGRERMLVSDEAARQLARLRARVENDDTLVLASAYRHGVRVSRISAGRVRCLSSVHARGLIEELGLSELTYWVASRHTDFVDRRVNKASGLARLLEDLALDSMRLAAMGDGSCDLPALRKASMAILPTGTLPAYIPPPAQRLRRARGRIGVALWEAACYLVPNRRSQALVRNCVSELRFPDWFPAGLRRNLPSSPRLLPRLAAALASMR